MTVVLELDGVSRSYQRNVPVLQDLSLRVQRDEVCAILGRNGTGKTTLMLLAMGLLRPDRGTVRVFGLSPIDSPLDVKRRIGYAGEQGILPADATIPELLALHRKVFPSWDRVLERELLDRFELSGVTRKISKLSRGQVQQASLLFAVSHRPELLLLDEPAAGLDPAARREFLETSIQLLNREGTAIVFSSHHMGDVERLGGRVVLLADGRVRLDADLDALREQHCLAVVPRSAIGGAALKALPNCVSVRAHLDEWHAIMRGTPFALQQQLAGLGLPNARCATMPLEELFVELVGRDRGAA